MGYTEKKKNQNKPWPMSRLNSKAIRAKKTTTMPARSPKAEPDSFSESVFLDIISILSNYITILSISFA